MLSKKNTDHATEFAPAESRDDTVEAILRETEERDGEASSPSRSNEPTDCIDGVVIGRLFEVNESGAILVDFPGNPAREAVEAASTARPTPADVGREVALAFERGDPRKPIVLGMLWSSRSAAPAAESGGDRSMQVNVDDERLTLTAEREIVLRCGKSSITLTREGRVLLRGVDVLSRASGVNRVKGGAVQIN